MGNININITQGLGRKATNREMVSGLVMAINAAPSGLAFNTTSPKLRSVQDAVDLGITEASDTSGAVLVYHHIKEFFRINPDGELYIRLVAQTTPTMAAMCDVANAHLKALLEDANGNIHQAGVVLNPIAAYSSTTSGGLDADVIAAIPKAQALADYMRSQKSPVIILLEGREFNGTVASAQDLKALECPDVVVTIASDNEVSERASIHDKYAAVGMTLGLISKAKVSENPGRTIARFNVEDRISGAMVQPGLSNGNLASTLSAQDYDTLTYKGFNLVRNYVQQSGAYLNDSMTCDLLTSDFYSAELRRTINYGIRLAYDGVFPRINSPILVDPATGKMEGSTAKAIESEVKAAMSPLLQNQDASGIDVYVDPDQDVLNSNEVIVRIAIVPVGVARKITVKIGFQPTI